MKFPIPDSVNKLIENFLAGKDSDMPDEDFEDCDCEGVSLEELEQLPVYRTLRESVQEGMDLDALIDAFAAMCRIPVEEDDLLFETGTFNFTGKKLFYFSLVRQFQYKSGDEFIQLHLDIRYAPSPATKRLQCTEWGSVTDGDFFAMVRAGDAYRIVREQPITEVEIYIEET